MKCSLPFLVGLLVVVPFGCLFDSGDDTPEVIDRGGYTLHVEPLQFDSYPGGGGLVLAYIEPDSEFTGDVDIRIDTPDNIKIKTVPEKAVLTKYLQLVEIEIYPDSTATPGETEILIIDEHAIVCDTTFVSIILTLTVIDDSILQRTASGKNPPTSLINWISEYFPEYDIRADGSYFCWCDDFSSLRLVWRYINPSWDIKTTGSLVGYPPRYVWYLVRIRGHVEPLFCLQMNEQGQIVEIPASSFGKAYP